MRTLTAIGFQGDVMLQVVEAMRGARPTNRKGAVVVAHSATGHHHAITGDATLHETDDPLVGYICTGDQPVELTHHRDHDAHEPWHIPARTIVKVTRQREMRPDGWSRVVD